MPTPELVLLKVLICKLRHEILLGLSSYWKFATYRMKSVVRVTCIPRLVISQTKLSPMSLNMVLPG